MLNFMTFYTPFVDRDFSAPIIIYPHQSLREAYPEGNEASLQAYLIGVNQDYPLANGPSGTLSHLLTIIAGDGESIVMRMVDFPKIRIGGSRFFRDESIIRGQDPVKMRLVDDLAIRTVIELESKWREECGSDLEKYLGKRPELPVGMSNGTTFGSL